MAHGRKMWQYRTTPRVRKKYSFSGTDARKYLQTRYASMKNFEYKAKTGRLGKKLESGFYEDQTWGALYKAWAAYIWSQDHSDWERQKYYAAVIQKLEREMNLKLYDFDEIKYIASEFLDEINDNNNISQKDDNNNSAVSDMSLEEIEELMRKSDTEFWSKVNES